MGLSSEEKAILRAEAEANFASALLARGAPTIRSRGGRARLLKVVDASGNVVSIATHAQVLQGVSRAADVDLSFADGRRPHVLFCEFCRAAFTVPTKGAIPRACKACSAESDAKRKERTLAIAERRADLVSLLQARVVQVSEAMIREAQAAIRTVSLGACESRGWSADSVSGFVGAAHGDAPRRAGARPRPGTVYRHRDHFDVRVRLPDGKKSSPIHLSPDVDEVEARRIAAELSTVNPSKIIEMTARK